MGIIVTKTDNDTELNRRINADLRARAVETAAGADPDLVEDSDYARDLKKTSRFGWVWIVLIALAVVSLGCIFFV